METNTRRTLIVPYSGSNNRQIKKWTVQDVIDIIPKIGLKKTKSLKPHQFEGIIFCLNHRENGTGCILAHDMGLGKTLQSLIVLAISNLVGTKGTALVMCPLAASDNWVNEIKNSFDPIPSVLQCKGKENKERKYISYRQRGKKIEVIEIDPDKIDRNFISTYDIVLGHFDAFKTIWREKFMTPLKQTFNLQNKKKDDWELDKQDKLNMLSARFPELIWPQNKTRADAKILDVEIIPQNAGKLLGPLLSFHYKVFIVDEAHNMKNPKTNIATMCYAISAEHRMCLTGTPKVNYSEDVWSQFHFLRIPGLVSLSEFKKKAADIRKLEAHYANQVQMFGKEQAEYFHAIELRLNGKGRSKGYVEDLYTKYMHRVTKQEIAKSENSDSQMEDAIPTTTTTTTTTTNMSNISSNVANDPPPTMLYITEDIDERTLDEKIVIHASKTLNSRMCRKEWQVSVPEEIATVYEKVRIYRMQKVDPSSVDENNDNKDNISQDDNDEMEGIYAQNQKIDVDPKNSSSYVFATMQLLRQICCDPYICQDTLATYCSQEEIKNAIKITPPKFKEAFHYIQERVYDDEKVVIFCYYKEACARLAHYLTKQGTGKCVIVTGSTDKNEKTRIINDFQTTNYVKILIATMCLKEGITLTRANHCIFVTNWWNSADEMQSAGRLHRLGQERDVHVNYLMMQGTIDERIKEISESKGGVPSSRDLCKILGVPLDAIKESDISAHTNMFALKKKTSDNTNDTSSPRSNREGESNDEDSIIVDSLIKLPKTKQKEAQIVPKSDDEDEIIKSSDSDSNNDNVFQKPAKKRYSSSNYDPLKVKKKKQTTTDGSHVLTPRKTKELFFSLKGAKKDGKEYKKDPDYEEEFDEEENAADFYFEVPPKKRKTISENNVKNQQQSHIEQQKDQHSEYDYPFTQKDPVKSNDHEDDTDTEPEEEIAPPKDGKKQKQNGLRIVELTEPKIFTTKMDDEEESDKELGNTNDLEAQNDLDINSQSADLFGPLSITRQYEKLIDSHFSKIVDDAKKTREQQKLFAKFDMIVSGFFV